MTSKKHTRFDLQKMKETDQTAVWITAYDYWTASFAEKAGMDHSLHSERGYGMLNLNS